MTVRICAAALAGPLLVVGVRLACAEPLEAFEEPIDQAMGTGAMCVIGGLPPREWVG
jgi:hypothetical protein